MTLLANSRGLDLIGQTFGRLTVIKREGQDKFGQKMWMCVCGCLAQTIVSTLHDRLKFGWTIEEALDTEVRVYKRAGVEY
jgi:hypothetical protein